MHWPSPSHEVSCCYRQRRCNRPETSVCGLLDGGGDLANGQKHSPGLGPIAECATGQVDRSEAQGRIECDRIGFGIHDNTDTARAIPHFQSERQHRTQKKLADPMSLEARVHGQSGQAQDGQRVGWEV
jgi:hypothetical protein